MIYKSNIKTSHPKLIIGNIIKFILFPTAKRIICSNDKLTNQLLNGSLKTNTNHVTAITTTRNVEFPTEENPRIYY